MLAPFRFPQGLFLGPFSLISTSRQKQLNLPDAFSTSALSFAPGLRVLFSHKFSAIRITVIKKNS